MKIQASRIYENKSITRTTLCVRNRKMIFPGAASGKEIPDVALSTKFRSQRVELRVSSIPPRFISLIENSHAFFLPRERSVYRRRGKIEASRIVAGSFLRRRVFITLPRAADPRWPEISFQSVGVRRIHGFISTFVPTLSRIRGAPAGNQGHFRGSNGAGAASSTGERIVNLASHGSSTRGV